MFDVVRVEAHLFVKRQVGAAGNLCHAGHARLDGEHFAPLGFILCDFLWQVRTRTDKAHLTNKDEIELREFVDACATNKASETRYTWIVFELKQWRTFTFIAVYLDKVLVEAESVGVLYHRTEFHKMKRFAIFAHTHNGLAVREFEKKHAALAFEYQQKSNDNLNW